MKTRSGNPSGRARSRGAVFVALAGATLAVGAIIPTTLEDFHLSGTQVGDVGPESIFPADECAACHALYDPPHEPYSTWKGSLMGMAGRDPLFYAQMTTANQDVDQVGYFCMRCHVPLSFVSGHAYDTWGQSLDDFDRDGVTCHFCHAMVDPVYKDGISPREDKLILGSMPEVPEYYGNAMFVLDPLGTRRGPYADARPPHEALYSPFHRTGEFCGTCHDVGNVAVSRQPDGTYRYNELDQRTPDEDPRAQFPLERTYTEWKLSKFAAKGVDMGGRFGGNRGPIVRTCQDCHMPTTTARGCPWGPKRDDLAIHEFAGASSWVLEIIADYWKNNPYVDPELLEIGRQKAVDMIERSATLELAQECGTVRLRVVNETGHKLPTGHIEGRRVFVNVKVLDDGGDLLVEYGRYDFNEATLDEESTVVYEMHVGLSDEAARVTGLPPGVTGHMALADTIVKDNRIPPRGFNNEAYEAGGAPVVGASYADGQYWDDTHYDLPTGAARVVATVYYQTVTRHYIEALRDGNYTDHWGRTLYRLWLRNNKGAPVPIASAALALAPFARGDFDGDRDVDLDDYRRFAACLAGPGVKLPPGCGCACFYDGDVDLADAAEFQTRFTGP